MDRRRIHQRALQDSHADCSAGVRLVLEFMVVTSSPEQERAGGESRCGVRPTAESAADSLPRSRGSCRPMRCLRPARNLVCSIRRITEVRQHRSGAQMDTHPYRPTFPTDMSHMVTDRHAAGRGRWLVHRRNEADCRSHSEVETGTALQPILDVTVHSGRLRAPTWDAKCVCPMADAWQAPGLASGDGRDANVAGRTDELLVPCGQIDVATHGQLEVGGVVGGQSFLTSKGEYLSQGPFIGL